MSVNVENVKRAAAGRWRQILVELGGICPELLDGQHHPCPRCGGKDRFSMVDAEAGALLCRKCFSTKNGDGISALMWLTGIEFPETVEKLGAYLGLAEAAGNGQHLMRNRSRATYATAQEAVAAAGRQVAGGKLTATWWYYVGETPVLGVVRIEIPAGGKTYRPVSSEATGKWMLGDPAGPLPLYRLPALLAAAPSETVFVLEGEKTADAGAEIGLLTATTSPHGAKAARRADWTPLAGREVVILPDNDDPGQAYADTVAGILEQLEPPAKVTICKLPWPPAPGSDLADLVADRREDGKDDTAIRQEVLDCVATAKAAARTFTTITSIAAMPKVAEPKFLIDGLIYEETFTILGGDPKSGKSMLGLTMCLSVLTGKPMFDRLPVFRTGPVAILQADMGEGYFAFVLRQLARGLGIRDDEKLQHPISFHCSRAIDLQDAKVRVPLAEEIGELAPALILLDPMRDLHSGNEDRSEELKPVLDFALQLRDTGASVVMVDHLTKPSRERGRGRGEAPAGYLLRGSGAKYGRADSVLICQDLGGTSAVSGIHRYGPAPEPLYFAAECEADSDRISRIVEREPPEFSEDRTSPAERVEKFFRESPGWHSLREVRTGARCRHEDAKSAVVNLYGRSIVEHDKGSYNTRKWRLCNEES